MKQYREHRVVDGYLASHDPRVHFGLGDAEVVNRVHLRWPSGIEQEFENLPARRIYHVHETDGIRDLTGDEGE